MGKGLILPQALMADQCKSPAPPEETAQSTPLRMGSSAGDLWEGAWQVRNPVLVISTTHSDPCHRHSSVCYLTPRQPSPFLRPGPRMACLLLFSQGAEVELVNQYLTTRIWFSLLSPTDLMSSGKSPDLSLSQFPHTSAWAKLYPPTPHTQLHKSVVSSKEMRA